MISYLRVLSLKIINLQFAKFKEDAYFKIIEKKYCLFIYTQISRLIYKEILM